MKKLFIIITVLVNCFVFSTAFAATNDLKTIRVGVYNNSPKIYKDEQGNIKGFWADITNYIADKEQWNLIYDFGTWDEELVKLEKGDIDMMVDVAVSDERKQLYDFNSETALLSWSIIYTRKGFEINSFQDLEGKNIGVIKSSIHYTAPLGLKNVLSSFGINANVIDVKNMDDVFKLLDTNQADAGVVNWQFGVSNENKYKVNRSGIIFNPSELNYALTKNSPKNNYLIGVLDLYLRDMKNDKNSIYYHSLDTNFGQYMNKMEVIPKWLFITLIAIGTLVAILILILLFIRQYNKILKREIDLRVHEIKENEEKYSAVVKHARDGIVIIQDKIVKLSNYFASNTLGYKVSEMENQPFIKFVAPESRKQLFEMYKMRLEGKKTPTFYESKLQHKNGSIVDVEITAETIQYGGKIADVVIARNITERKKTEKEVLFKNALLEGQYETTIDGILVVGVDGKTISSNNNFIKMWGIPKELFATRNDKKMLEFVMSKIVDSKAFLAKVNYLYAHNDEKSFDEVYLKDERVFERYSSPLSDVNKKYYGRIWYFRDITERKQSEIRMKKLDELKSTFIEIVSHQLRTPLSSTNWNLEMMLKGEAGKMSEGQEELLKVAYDANKEIITRIGDLLTSMDIEEKRIVLNKQRTQFESLINSVCGEYQSKYEFKKIKHAIDCPKESLMLINIDAQRIRDVIAKFIDNSISYTKEGGGIVIKVRKPDHTLRFEISDTGIGIPKAEQQFIFDRFYRASNAFTMKPDASGLGLYISKHFIEAHGGKIGFNSVEGKGSTFWFELPLE